MRCTDSYGCDTLLLRFTGSQPAFFATAMERLLFRTGSQPAFFKKATESAGEALEYLNRRISPKQDEKRLTEPHRGSVRH